MVDVIAHHQACTNPKTLRLHRDISDDNMLIYPRIRTEDGKGLSIVWTGLLIDWELSKPRDSTDVPMSVAGVRLVRLPFLRIDDYFN